MKKIPITINVVLVSVFLWYHFAFAQRFGASPSTEYKITVDGRERTYRLYVPGDAKK